MNMSQKIARAAMKRWHYANMTAVPDFDTLPDLEKERWLLVADGVLDALTDPTEGMVTTGMEVISSGAVIWPGDEKGFNATPDASKWVFSGMIRAAKEGK